MSKHCAIYETLNPITEMKVTKSDEGLMTLRGTFGVCGVRNNNQRVYETSNYSKMVTEMQARIKENGGIPGELEHPQTMNITLENVSHKITEIQIDENGLVSGTIQLLNTPKGKIAQAIVEGGLPLFVSSRAVGQVAKDGKVTLEKLSTYDLVGTPGFSQARMHLNESQVCESLSDNITLIISEEESNENKEDMNISQELLEKFESMEARITELEAQNEALREEVDEAKMNILDPQQLATGIQNWIVEQYTPNVQQWLTEEFATHVKAEALTEAKTMIVKQVAPKIQQWVIEEFAPEVQNWVCENYSPEVEKWVLNQVAPGIQSWMVEHFSPEIENWVTENFGAKVEEMIAEGLKSDKNSKMKNITDVLAMLESIDVKKPEFGGRVIRENAADEPLYIQNMPEASRVKWNMASKEVRESIERRAKLYDFTNEGAIERFWAGINFDEIKPVANITEGLENIEDLRERNIRYQFRRHRQQF